MRPTGNIKVLGSIKPEGWQVHRIDELAIRGTGHTPDKETPEYWDGDISWVSLTDCNRLDQVYISESTRCITQEGIDNSSAVVHPAGIVLMSRDAGVGQSAVTTRPMAVSQHFVTWQCGERLQNLYLYYWLQLLKPEFERIANGSTIKTIGMPYFSTLGIMYPEQGEQNAICSILLQWDHGIRQLNDLIATKLRFKRGLMQQLLTGLRRFPEFTDKWTPVPIGSFLTESRIPGTHGAEARKLTVKLYGKGVIPKSDTRAGSEATKYYRRKAGQFIYSKLDFLNGAFGIVPAELDGYESTLDLPAFDIGASVDPDWFRYFVVREAFYKNLLGLANGGRKARRVNPDDLLKVNIPCPTKAEQQRIAEVLKACDHEIDLIRQELEALKQQKKGLMQKLLTGQVRVRAVR